MALVVVVVDHGKFEERADLAEEKLGELQLMSD